MEDIIIEPHGVNKLIKKLKVAKAFGPDNIPNDVLKECPSELMPAITAIFQKSIDSSDFYLFFVKKKNQWGTLFPTGTFIGIQAKIN